jgi:hypothetical protein
LSGTVKEVLFQNAVGRERRPCESKRKQWHEENVVKAVTSVWETGMVYLQSGQNV